MRFKTRRFVIQIVFLSLCAFSYSQNDIVPTYEIESVSVGSNLSSLHINKLFQDSHGFIWLGTDMGLARYDGLEFTNFNFTHGSKIAAIYDILEDSEGKIWAGGENGLFFYNGHQFEKSLIKENSIWAIMLDQNNNLHIAGSNFTPKYFSGRQRDSIVNGLSVDGNTITSEAFWEKSFNRNTVWEMEVDDQGSIWIGLENSLLHLEGSKLAKVYSSENSKVNISEIVAINSDSVYWGNETTGLYFKNKNSIEMIIDPIVYIMERTDSSVLFLTPMDLIKYEDQHYDTLSTLDFHDHLYFKDMILDREGNIWIATEGSLLKLSKQYFHSWDFNQSAILQSNHSITQLKSGKIIIGSSKKKIIQWENGKFQPFGEIPAAHNSTTEAILEEDNGKIWYGTSMSGIILEEKGEKTEHSEESGLIDKTILFLKRDRFNRLWCGGENGISEIFQNDTGLDFKNFIPEDKSNTIPRFIDFTCLVNGKCFAVSTNAIYELGQSELLKTHFKDNKELPIISKVLLLDSEELLVATLGMGILKIKMVENNIWDIEQVWNTSTGLLSDNILNIHLDRKSRLWAISKNGACLLEELDTRCYDVNDGWLPLESTHVDLHEANNGNLWIVANSSVTVFPLYSLSKNLHSPEVFITNIELFKDASDISSFISSPKEAGHKLVLPHDQNFIEFSFVSTSLTKNGKNKFTYKLDGLDHKWNPPTSKTSVQYAGLKPKTYTFQVRAINNSGIIGSDIASYSFKITSHWSARWWAIIFYALATMLILYYIFTLINAKKNKDLEASRFRSINDFQNNFYTNISHEFRTPLTVILGVTDQIKEALKASNIALNNEVEMINRNAGSLLSLVNQILNLSKLRAAKPQMVYVNVEVIGFISQVVESIQAFANSQDKELLFYSEENQLHMDIDEESISTLLINLISKVISRTDKKRKVIIHVKQYEVDPKYLSIKIKGDKISSEVGKQHHNNIVEKMAEHENSTSNEIEIALARQILDALEGKLEISGSEDYRADFQILLPIMNRGIVKNVQSTFTPKTSFTEQHKEVVNFGSYVEGRSNILLVEDNSDVANYIISLLSKIYNVIYAHNGSEAIAMIEENAPDLVVCDIMMPMMNGYEVCEILKSREKTKNIPIILLTAKADKNARILGIDKGADAYFTKPFSQAEFLGKVNQLVQKSLRTKDGEGSKEFFSFLNQKSKGEEHLFIKEAINFILANIENDIYGPIFLAKDLGISESSLYKKLKSISGKSTAVFMRSVRLAKARELLLGSNHSISEVARMTGFKNSSWFSRAFKKEFAYPPSELRKENP